MGRIHAVLLGDLTILAKLGRQVDLRKIVPGPFVGLEGDLAAEEWIVGPCPVFEWLAWIGAKFERTAPTLFHSLFRINN